ncbi:unnamed protein product [Ranitomeya imitator]|uniref:Large subunit GTPase 1 n=1 Tax=Ranitomeya imitator TaxID=111125 RepID=A0ABN9LT49_9NEOB|nr:unnamed protein product [Ranitomeya imitator]
MSTPAIQTQLHYPLQPPEGAQKLNSQQFSTGDRRGFLRTGNDIGFGEQSDKSHVDVMGKKKATSGLGRALMKDRAQSQRGLRAKDSWLHTSELNDGYDWGRLNLQSVTEQSSIDDFLATAELAGTEFAAGKRMIITFLVNSLSYGGSQQQGKDWCEFPVISLSCSQQSSKENLVGESLTWSVLPNTFFKVATFCFDDCFAHSWHSLDELQEKLNIKFVPAEARTGLLTSEESNRIHKLHEENEQFLCIPRRPYWDRSTSAEVLKQSERENFLEWRRQLAKLEEEKKLILTPFERNLDFWRQLWRVLERSDIVVQIVDGRNPLLFRCQDLERYVKEVNPHKENIILINKADLLTEYQRQAWAAHFEKRSRVFAHFVSCNESKQVHEMLKLTCHYDYPGQYEFIDAKHV